MSTRTDRRRFRAALRYLVRRRPSAIVATPSRLRADILAAQQAHADAIDAWPELQRLVAAIHAQCDELDALAADLRAENDRLDAVEADTVAVAEAVDVLLVAS